MNFGKNREEWICHCYLEPTYWKYYCSTFTPYKIFPAFPLENWMHHFVSFFLSKRRSCFLWNFSRSIRIQCKHVDTLILIHYYIANTFILQTRWYVDIANTLILMLVTTQTPSWNSLRSHFLRRTLRSPRLVCNKSGSVLVSSDRESLAIQSQASVVAAPGQLWCEVHVGLLFPKNGVRYTGRFSIISTNAETAGKNSLARTNTQRRTESCRSAP